jgi:glucosamine 6-phosphate synthetase-like amidotransferase/phosphosugar isomerase protein
MCGIAGYSLSPASDVDRTLAAQVLLAAIAERGADAVGYAFRTATHPVHVHKQRSGASALLERVRIPQCAAQALIHVRDYTKGHPTIAANNHPIRHGAVVGVHNGIIRNDDELFAALRIERAMPEMTVDSEIIFAVAEQSRGRTAAALDQLYGSMATAWLDEARPELVVARGMGRPLWLGIGQAELFFASTRLALDLVARYTKVRLRMRELEIGTLVAADAGRVVASERFSPDLTFEEEPLPAVRAPHEGASCLARLAALAA